MKKTVHNKASTYHHGNLRQALITAALEVIEASGYQSLSLRELAEKLEVSRAAPYRHFADRDALLEAVACEGFQLLLTDCREIADNNAIPRLKAEQMCRAFIHFTEQHAELFMLMYDSGMLSNLDEQSELGVLLRETYEGVGGILTATLGELPPAQIKARLISMWSTIYGFARLNQSHMLKPYMLGELNQQQVLDTVIATALGPVPG